MIVQIMGAAVLASLPPWVSRFWLPDSGSYCPGSYGSDRVIGLEELFGGTIDGRSVHPHAAMIRSLTHDASAVNSTHAPSVFTEPSRADMTMTRRLQDALTLTSSRVLDHFVPGRTDIVSFAKRGLM